MLNNGEVRIIVDVSKNPQLVKGVLADSGLCVCPKVNLNTTTGVRITFYTDANKVKLNYKLDVKKVPPHNGNILQNGIQYAISNKNYLLKMDACYNYTGQYSGYILENNENFVKVELYLPSYNSIKTISIEVPDECDICPPPLGKNYLFLGGQYTMGEGCTFASSMFSNILAHREKAYVYNCSSTTGMLSNCSKYIQLLPHITKLQFDRIFIELDLSEVNAERLAQLNELLKKYTHSVKCPISLFPRPYIDKMYDKTMEVVHNSILIGDNIHLIDTQTTFQKYDYDRYSYSQYVYNDYSNYLLSECLTNQK